MCESLSGIRQAIVSFGQSFDPATISVAQADKVLRDAAAIEAVASTLKALASTRLAESHSPSEGSRSAAESVAKRTGTSTSSARKIVETGKRLRSQSQVSAAALSGELSPTQASLVAEGAEADPNAVRELLATARTGSIGELKDHVTQVKANQEDLAARHRRIHAERRLRQWTQTDGSWHLHASGTVEDGAQITAAITTVANEVFAEARRAGRRESPDAYAFDALLEICLDVTSEGEPAPRDGGSDPSAPDRDDAETRPGPWSGAVPSDNGRAEDLQAADWVNESGHISGSDSSVADEWQGLDPLPTDSTSSPGTTEIRDQRGGRKRRRRRGAPVKILLRVDFDTFMRGYALDGETCEIAGYGQIPVFVVDDILAHGDPFLAAIVTKTRKLVGAVHLGRYPTAHQTSALEWFYPTCAAEGCNAKVRLQRDHRIDWADTHFTVIECLDRLCSYHHGLKTTQNWALVEGHGKRAFVPPDHPRHPRHRRYPGPPATATTRDP